MMHEFKPTEIYIEPDIKDHQVAKRILSKYPGIPVIEVSHRREIKIPQHHTDAKKQLFLSKFRGTAIRACQGMGNEYVCCNYYTTSLVTDCHLECTYCILQDYLKNNPVITVYTNIEDILAEIEQKIAQKPDELFRFGPGELSDSLALDHITEFSKDLIAFANKHKNVVIELKTKTNNIETFVNESHRGNVVVSWSLNPQKYITTEELKCASLTERLTAAETCHKKGFPVAFHLDPLLCFKDWQIQYENLIKTVAEYFGDKKIAWISLGTLRFTPELKKITNERFPKSKIMTAELYPTKDGKVRYFRPIREDMYRHLTKLIKEYLPLAPFYLCMETKSVWKSVFGFVPKNNQAVEKQLAQRFAV